jgi:hypothetical protein
MTDKGTVRIVVVFVGLVALLLVGGIVILAAFEKPAPTALETLAGTSVGGLLGVLISTRNSIPDPLPPEGEV